MRRKWKNARRAEFSLPSLLILAFIKLIMGMSLAQFGKGRYSLGE